MWYWAGKDLLLLMLLLFSTTFRLHPTRLYYRTHFFYLSIINVTHMSLIGEGSVTSSYSTQTQRNIQPSCFIHLNFFDWQLLLPFLLLLRWLLPLLFRIDIHDSHLLIICVRLWNREGYSLSPITRYNQIIVSFRCATDSSNEEGFTIASATFWSWYRLFIWWFY